ncbi:unannotated protein [freshwater metagenome]|uniref:Unannotated protein n=1 Tax=freshwater metagenome TaxID=449393 RepID=A0A6J6ASH0_9ZZZZ|nr:S8 family serine peptidase [Actinomycetota bacterium]
MYQSKITRSQWRSWFSISLICALGVQFLPTPVAGADAPTNDYIVMFSDNADLQAKISKEARLGNSISQVYDNAANGFVAELDASDVRRLKADREVLVVELDRVIKLDDDSVTTSTSSTSTTSSSITTSTTSSSSSTSSTTSTTIPTSSSTSTTSSSSSTSSSSTTSTTSSTSTTSTSTSTTTSTTVPVTVSELGEPVPNSYIISLRGDVPVQQFVSAEQGLGVNVLQVFTQAINGYVAVLTSAEKSRLEKDSRVLSIEQDAIVTVDGDQANPPSWGLDRIDQRGVTLDLNYSYSFTGVGVSAYVIDTGVRADHSQFSGRVSVGYTSISDGRGSADCHGHGTHVSGTIGGSTYGVAKSVSIVPVRVLGCTGSGSTSGVIAGINWMITHHQSGVPAVANMSLGGSFSSSMNEAVANAVSDGIVMAVAAGNSNANACNYSPASAQVAITVGATTSADERASYSNYGNCLDIFAPGSSIVSSWFSSSNAIRSLSGTSMASPHVAGAAALLLESDSAMSPAAVREKLITFATPDAISGAGSGSVNLLVYTKSAWSAPVPIAPSVPRDLIAIGGNASAALSWVAPTSSNGNEVTDYVVEYSSNNGAAWSTFNDGTSASTSATVTGLVNSTVYLFRVSAVSSAGTSSPSSSTTATIGIPGAPNSLLPTALNLSIGLTWSAPLLIGGSALTDYVIEYSSDAGTSYTVFADGVSTSRATTVTGLTNGTSYLFRVKAVNSIGTGSASGVVSATPWSVAVPSAPRDVLISTVSLDQIAIRWTAPLTDGGSSVVDYVIEYSSNAGVSWSLFVDNFTPNTSVTVTGLTSGTTYIFRVRAVNGAGTSAVSASSAAAAPGVPSEPCCVNDAQIGPGYVAIRWGAPTSNGGSPITNYVIEYSVNDGVTWTTWSGWTGVAGCVCANVARTVSPLADGVAHIFRVRAQNAIGLSQPSVASDASTPWTPIAPGAPTSLTVTARTGQVDLDWEEPTSDGGAFITDYTIQYSTNSGTTWTTFVDGVSTSTFVSMRTLSVGVSHIFRVQATNSAGTGVPTSATAPITTIGSLLNDPFSGAIAISGANSFTLSSTLTSTRESGEPTHGGYAPSASIWYKWVATETGTLVLTTLSSDFDTLLGVYTGSAVNGLTTVAVNDDAVGEIGVWSRVTVAVRSGTTYQIAIDGYSGKKGSTRLNWQYTAAPIPQAPTAPQNVRASAGNASANLYWLAPTSDGNATITSYTTTSSPGAKTCSTSGALTCVVSGLTNGVAYTFTVTATNSAGTSIASAASSAVTPVANPDGGVTALSWGLDRIDQRNLPLNSLYARNYSGAGVNAYIIDTGILASHGEFGGRVTPGFSSISDGRGSEDCNGHGTHVAGTVAGSNYGVAPSASLIAVRVLDCGGSGSTSGVIAGIDWVVENHQSGVAAVANMSLGGSRSAALDLAVARGVDDGVVFVVAAGNSNADACNYSPAAASSAITVGSTTSADDRSSFSNYGSCVDVFAPGSNITSSWYTSNSATNTISGTSMASPHVAGIAALALSANSSLSVSGVTSWITSSATAGVVTGPGSGSPNILAYSLLSASPPAGSSTGATTTTTTTSTTTTTTTTIPSRPTVSWTLNNGVVEFNFSCVDWHMTSGVLARNAALTNIVARASGSGSGSTCGGGYGISQLGELDSGTTYYASATVTDSRGTTTSNYSFTTSGGTTTTTAAPSSGGGGGSSGGGGGSSGGGGGGGGGSRATTTTVLIRSLIPVNTFTSVPNLNGAIPNIPNVLPTGAGAPIIPNGFPTGFQTSNGDSANRPTLGQPMPPLLVNTPQAAATAKAVGNAVTFKVTAKTGATVNIYRNGILVSTVPASAAASIKVADNPGGVNTFQIVVVDKDGAVSASPKKTVAIGSSSPKQNTNSGAKTKTATSKTATSKAATSKAAVTANTTASKAGK